MKRLIYAIPFLLVFATHLTAALAQPCRISGVIIDQETGERLPGATGRFANADKGFVASVDGSFAITLQEGRYTLTVSFIGYREYEETIELKHNMQMTIPMQPEAITAGEVVVTGKRAGENILKTVDNLSLDRGAIENVPYLFGQADIMKTLQLLPGVQANGEGSSGIYVRGGAIDQNLILLDKAPIYNTGHLFGFFSLFNPSAVGDVELIKGGIPASDGGRLSSILRIETRSGDFQRVKGEASIGLIAGDIAIEGPIQKNKSSFILTARRTYIDLVSKALTKDPTIFNTGIDYYFDDVNAKLDFKLSQKDRVALSGYMGHDDFVFDGKNTLYNAIRWGNKTASLAWDHFYHRDVSHNSTLYVSDYRMNFSAGVNNYLFQTFSTIRDMGAKQEWVFSFPKTLLKSGGELILHRLIPNNMQARTEDVDLTFTEQEELISLEEAFYISGEHEAGEHLKVSAGLRFSAFQQLGPFTRYHTDQSMTIVDTTFYNKNKIIQAYHRLEPRLSLLFRLNGTSSLKAAMDVTSQYLHMAPLSSVSLPTDVWVPGSSRIKPQTGLQYSLGYFRNFNDDEWETSATLYYKKMQRQIEYRDGVIVGYSKGYNYDDNFIFGEGRAYGLETLIKKNTGRTNGWISYTLSRTERNFNEINGGAAFPAKYDRLHNLSVVATHRVSDKWSLSGAFVYSTGNALTLPVGRYIIDGNIINEYAGRNTFRMPAYHRMDLSAVYRMPPRKRYTAEWIFSVYNVYNRRNPYYIYLDTKGNINDYYLEVNLKKVSLFPVLPSVSYRVKF